MLTRLQVSGFKNLVDVDVHFGPFTCVAGANGVGKSNLFDAITFLSALADKPLNEAAMAVRSEEGRTSDIRSIFHRTEEAYTDEIAFGVEMIVPKEVIDDLGQVGTPSITFLRYELVLGYSQGQSGSRVGGLELRKEILQHINLGDAKRHLPFNHSAAWRKSAIAGRRTSSFISTETENGVEVIKLHQDGGSRGKPLSRLAATLPRTVLSAANAAESPTVVAAKREMQSWVMLQLEPTALRRPDPFTAPTHMGRDGSHLAATINRLAHDEAPEDPDHSPVYAQVTSRLGELIEDVRGLKVEKDEQRELYTLHVMDGDGTFHPSRSLSDGTLRFLALAVIDLDPGFSGLLCLEEPENGIHPARIPAVISLLQDIAVDVNEAAGTDNPLRQVIVNTHSPSVVMEVPDDSLLVAEGVEQVVGKKYFKSVKYRGLPGTWRDAIDNVDRPASRGKLLAYLNPAGPRSASTRGRIAEGGGVKRVVDREDLQLMLPLPGNEG